MLNNRSIAVVIPCYKVEKEILSVIDTLPDFIDYVIAVDDKCPNQTGKVIEDKINSERVIIVYHNKNQGVGGAVVSGYKKAIELEADIVVKMDGDGQMDPNYLQPIVDPIIENKADYSKGNRFNDFKALRTMPKARLFGNSMLSFLLKASSGYWNIMDPTNGYTAISSDAIKKLNLEKISKRYFFESDMLIRLNILNQVVKDVPIPAKYGDEKSSLRIGNILARFPFKLFKGFCKRVFLKYYIYDFNMASIYTLFGLPMLFWGVFFGLYRWYIAITQDIVNTTGTVMLSILPLIVGVQFVLQAISIDINSIPKKD